MIFAKSTSAKLSLFNFVAKKEVFFYKTNSAEDSWRTKNSNDF